MPQLLIVSRQPEIIIYGTDWGVNKGPQIIDILFIKPTEIDTWYRKTQNQPGSFLCQNG
jgi:hypothetical protein